jgi:transposase
LNPRQFGTDLTAIDGIGVTTALVILTEVGPDLSCFKSEKHFASGLALCPDNRISGGKVLSSHTRRVINRVSDALRLAALSLERSHSAMGGYFRRMKAKRGAAEAITATAHKLARIIYRLIKYGEAYVRQGLEVAEKKFQERKLYAFRKTAQSLGFDLMPKSRPTPFVPGLRGNASLANPATLKRHVRPRRLQADRRLAMIPSNSCAWSNNWRLYSSPAF